MRKTLLVLAILLAAAPAFLPGEPNPNPPHRVCPIGGGACVYLPPTPPSPPKT
jgi:hypothetical protein